MPDRVGALLLWSVLATVNGMAGDGLLGTGSGLGYPHLGADGRPDYTVRAAAGTADGGLVKLTDVTVEVYGGATGTAVTAVLTTPACTYDQGRSLLTGTEVLEVASDALRLRGTGFAVDLKSRQLNLHKKVMARLRAQPLATGVLGRPAPAPAGAPPAAEQPITILADSFVYTDANTTGVFRGPVRVTNGELQLDCDQLDAECKPVPEAARANAVLGHGLDLTRLVATGEVKIVNLAGERYPFSDIGCRKATYTTATGDLVLADHVTVKTAEGPGLADTFTIHVRAPAAAPAPAKAAAPPAR